jgi:hypothetical protein
MREEIKTITAIVPIMMGVTRKAMEHTIMARKQRIITTKGAN